MTTSTSKVIGKSYSSAANARRAAKKAFGENWANTVEIDDETFTVSAIEKDNVVKMNKRLPNIHRAVPTPKRPPGSPRQSGAVAELWEHFSIKLSDGLRRVDVLDSLVEEGYNYWTTRTQLQLFMKALKADTKAAE